MPLSKVVSKKHSSSQMRSSEQTSDPLHKTTQVVLDLPRKEPKNATFKCLSKDVIEVEKTTDLNVDCIAYDKFFDFHHPFPTPVGPAIQVVSVSVTRSDPSFFRIFGEIFVSDYKSKKYFFYQCPRMEAETIEPYGRNDIFLSSVPVAPVLGGPIAFRIFRDDGFPIFDGLYDLNEALLNPDDGTYTLEGSGELGCQFKMVFNRTPFAILARVGMFLESPISPSPTEHSFKIHGTITANGVTCYTANVSSDTLVRYGVTTEMCMMTHILVVPIGSCLLVSINLYNQEFVLSEDTYEIAPAKGTMLSPRKWRFKCKDERFTFRMDVGWILHGDFFSHPDVQELDDPSLPLFMEHQEWDPKALVEVFSVSFSSLSSAAPLDLDICGKIVALDGGKNFYVFARDKDYPDSLSSSYLVDTFRTLSLAWPNDRWVIERGFNMYLELKDVENNLICRGELSWSNNNDTRYNHRLCDLIKGENGCLAAVHYSVFNNGRRAKVSIECHNFGPKFLVYGIVYTKYDNYDYPSAFEEQCYRSILFMRSKENRRLVKKYFDLPLLKSHVSTPSDCKELIVYVDLWVRPFTSSEEYQHFRFNSAESLFCDVGFRRVAVKVEYISSEFADPPQQSKSHLLLKSDPLSEPLNLFDDFEAF